MLANNIWMTVINAKAFRLYSNRCSILNNNNSINNTFYYCSHTSTQQFKQPIKPLLIYSRLIFFPPSLCYYFCSLLFLSLLFKTVLLILVVCDSTFLLIANCSMNYDFDSISFDSIEI